MYQPTKIEECFKSLLGFRNSTDPNVTQITDPELLASNTGLYYNDYHPLVRMDVLENIIPETGSLEAYLKNKVSQASNKVISSFANKKKEMRSTKTLLNSSAMFDGFARQNNLVIAESRFVGFEIQLKPSYGIQVVIDGIGLQFTQPQTGLTLYLYHTSQTDPIKTITANTTKSGGFEWLTLSETIDFSYYNDQYDTGGLFYLGYYESDIIGQAVKKDFNWDKGICYTCNPNAVKIWNTRLDFMRVSPMFVQNGDLNGTEMFDYRDATYEYSNNWGVNFKTTIKCDLSLYLCENKNIFAEAMGYQVAVDILNDIKYSDRANRIEEVNRNMVIRDLEGDTATREIGLVNRLHQSMSSLDFDFSKIDSPCIPCNKPTGFKIKSI